MEQDRDAARLAAEADRLRAEFFKELKQLHLRFGETKLEVLAKRGGMSKSYLSTLFNGNRTGLPGYELMISLVKAVIHEQPDAEVKHEIAVWRERWVRTRTAEVDAESVVTEHHQKMLSAAAAAAEDVIAEAGVRAREVADGIIKAARVAAEGLAEQAQADAERIRSQAEATAAVLGVEAAEEAVQVRALARRDAAAMRAEAEAVLAEARTKSETMVSAAKSESDQIRASAAMAAEDAERIRAEARDQAGRKLEAAGRDADRLVELARSEAVKVRAESLDVARRMLAAGDKSEEDKQVKAITEQAFRIMDAAQGNVQDGTWNYATWDEWQEDLDLAPPIVSSGSGPYQPPAPLPPLPDVWAPPPQSVDPRGGPISRYFESGRRARKALDPEPGTGTPPRRNS